MARIETESDSRNKKEPPMTKVTKKEDALCNKCAKPLTPPETDTGLAVEYFGGYHSYYLMDCTTYRFCICESCLRQMFSEFKIKPTLEDYFRHTNIDYSDDLKAYNQRIWETNGGFKQAYLNGICNCTIDCGKPALYTGRGIDYEDDDGAAVCGEYTDDAICEDHKDKYTNTMNIITVPFIITESGINMKPYSDEYLKPILQYDNIMYKE